MCFSHLFGFFEVRRIVVFITPANVASVNINSSILAARVALSALYCCVMAVNASWNANVDVCAFHVTTLAL